MLTLLGHFSSLFLETYFCDISKTSGDPLSSFLQDICLFIVYTAVIFRLKLQVLSLFIVCTFRIKLFWEFSIYIILFICIIFIFIRIMLFYIYTYTVICTLVHIMLFIFYSFFFMELSLFRSVRSAWPEC